VIDINYVSNKIKFNAIITQPNPGTNSRKNYEPEKSPFIEKINYDQFG